MSLIDADIHGLVSAWLGHQRWFAGKGRDLSRIEVRPLATIAAGPPEVTIWLCDVGYADGTHETYQLPLVARREPVGSLDHVLLGSLPVDGETHWIYDALHDKDVTQAWIDGIRDESKIPPLRFERFSQADELPVDQQSLALTSEQSNTSLIFGDEAILKVFRRLEAGLNPDIEIHRALTELGAANIARLHGSLTADIGGELVSLAMLQEFMNTATDGWELAKISVRDLMAEADLHAEEAGGDFAGEAERLGMATATVHADLAAAFGTDVLDRAELQARAATMHARLDAALAVIPELAGVEPGLRAAFDALAADAGPITTQRVHGDLHLGQALRTVRRWIILDFEGEPVKSLAERRAFDSPIRDVAAMLRSFDYAARHQLTDGPRGAQLEYRANEWAERNRDAFCEGYAHTAGYDPRADQVLLRGFEADKAVYEAMYEARNRPSWLSIPLASLARLGRSVDDSMTKEA